MGRRDSLSASKEAANNDIPGPNSTVATLVAKFENVGLALNDMVALSGNHVFAAFFFFFHHLIALNYISYNSS